MTSAQAPSNHPRHLPPLALLTTALLTNLLPSCVAQATPYALDPAPTPPQAAAPYAPAFFKDRAPLTRFGVAISHDGNECYFAVALNDRGRFREEIRFSRRDDEGNWTTPQPLLPEERTYKYVDPHFSPDGQQLYFIYTKPAAPPSTDDSNTKRRPNQAFDIYYVNRAPQGWSDPIRLPPPVGTPNANEYFVSLTSDRSIFFGSNRGSGNNFDLYVSRLDSKGSYTAPTPLPGAVNTRRYEADVFVSPDESFVIFSSNGRKDGQGQGDLYVSFKDADGNWGAGINLGDDVNSKYQEFAPSISRDQKALFFSRGGTLHWVSTNVIEALRD